MSEGECKRQVDSALLLLIATAELSNGSCMRLMISGGGGGGSETAVRGASKTLYAESGDTIFIFVTI